MDNALLQQLITAQQTTIELLQRQLSGREEPRVKPRAAAHAILPRLSKEDDIEAFLMTFERTATLEEWPPTEWASALAPLLTGVAQEAYFDLDSHEAADYGRLKTKILSRYQLTARDRAVKFHQWTYMTNQPVRAQIFALIRLMKQWLEPGKGVGHVIETLVVDKILRELPSDLKRVVGQTNPLSADDIAQAVETYRSTGELLKGDKKERKDSANPVPRLAPARPPPKPPNPLRRWEKSSPTQQGRKEQPGARDIFEAPSEEGTWKGFSSVTPGGDGEQPPHPSTEVDLPQELKGQFGTSQHRDPDLREAMRKVKVIDGRNVDGSETPFERIAMDLVGPLPKSARGHEYILVVVDYATKFPEAIPLRNMSSKGIAKELFMMFSRVGLPKTILTDQGTPFMSRLMKDLCRLYQVQQIRTSIFHPQTDGLCERLNKTIKSMLRRVVSRDGKNWDMLLPHLMFALREVPQASTGFSPFELLYGRPCRGILDLAKETWETQPCPFRSTIEHVTLMRDRLSAVWPIVKEHMEKAQRTQGWAYDKSATSREFSVGEKVMVLVPTVEHRLLAQWRGPYEVMKRVSPVNYLIKQPDRRKKVQLYHINLLKKYHGREEEVALMAMEGQGKEEVLPQVRHGQTLLPEQSRQLDQLIIHFGRVFSPFPGQTDVLFHHIHTEPGKKVHIRPYRIPEARRVIAKNEVREMLRMGVIEPSTSE
eukprot:XP_014053805.1 PREDICTED: uncharacterized protein LOC106604004 [Salmo salar]